MFDFTEYSLFAPTLFPPSRTLPPCFISHFGLCLEYLQIGNILLDTRTVSPGLAEYQQPDPDKLPQLSAALFLYSRSTSAIRRLVATANIKMTSLDDELLALAGDSSDEENASPPAKSNPASPQSPLLEAEPNETYDDDDEEDKDSQPKKSREMARKGVAKSTKASKSARRPRKQKRGDSDEDGEL